MLFDYVARGGAGLLVVIYVTGFLVVSFHSSVFGILEFNLVKPHMFSAGALFVALTALPCYAAMLTYSVGLALVAPYRLPTLTIRRTTLLTACWIAFYYFLCYTMAAGPQLFSRGMSPAFPRTLGFNLSLFVTLLALGLAALSHFYIRQAWFLFVPAYLIASGVQLWVVHRYFDRYFFRLTLWYFAVGVTALWLSHTLRSPKWRGTIQWELVPFSRCRFCFYIRPRSILVSVRRLVEERLHLRFSTSLRRRRFQTLARRRCYFSTKPTPVSTFFSMSMQLPPTTSAVTS